MRRVLSISLLLLFMLPLVSPLFAASTADANVPVCCRRNGKHHCMMAAAIAQRSSSDTGKAETASVQESCPYSAAVPAVVNLPFNPDEIQTAVSAVTISSSAHPTQIEVSPRVSIDRSHQKRGPPSLRLSRS
ncbi:MULTISPECIES: hypothetical protein [Acidobacteriaceae]|uniref:hypothetical protein n=1 Tax=Acidobacteriaceae TaxID=204434 RepID=UPI00131BB2EF|nr:MULTISPECIES: hypothetical protein [Acidobacteriaceae]MDW5264282.1 hypothetical protein [Edaphobacter sp.]